MPRGVARVDDNQPAMVAFLRRCGCVVQVLSPIGHGCPDLLVGTPRGMLLLIEVKDGTKPPSKRALTEDEREWHQRWRRFPLFVCESERDALLAIDHECTSFDFDRLARRTCSGCGREWERGTP